MAGQRARRLAVAAAAALLLLAPAAGQAPGDLRVALIVGNAAYPAPAALQNPVNDARAVAAAMRRIGFQVRDLHDASRTEMIAAVEQLRDDLKGKRAVAMLYYAGHGLQHDWRNFLVPVDAGLRRAEDIPVRALDIAQVFDAFRAAGNRLNLVVLDACRDNPFDNTLATKGLAPVDAPPGTFLALATAPGNVAEDGDPQGGNGLYTRFLLQELGNADARLEDVFRRVKLRVREHSGGRQVPSDSSNLAEEFNFARGFVRAERDGSAALRRFDAEKAAWERVRQSQRAEDFFAFLREYPSGFMSEIAQFRADQLARPLLVAQAGRDMPVALPGGVNRFRTGDEFTVTTTDRLTRLSRTEQYRVTHADDERVDINGGQVVWNQLGGVLLDDSGAKDPPLQLIPADIQQGKRWRSIFQNRVQTLELRTVLDFRTQALEDVEVAGTRVRAWRVDFEGFANVVLIQGQLWIEPQSMRLVRMDRTVRAQSMLVDASSITYSDLRRPQR